MATNVEQTQTKEALHPLENLILIFKKQFGGNASEVFARTVRINYAPGPDDVKP